jgi:MFS family permease
VPAIPAPFLIADFRTFWAARVMATIAGMMLVIVIGWQVYDIARQTMSPRDAAFLLGMVGLVQFVPVFSLTLVVGVIADRVDRRYIARAAVGLQFVCAATLGWLVLNKQVTLEALFIVAFLFGVARAFSGPSMSALAPTLVPREILPAAIALNSIGWHSGAVAGPPLGAFLYAAGPSIPYLLAAGLFAATVLALFRIGPVPRRRWGRR